MRSPFILLIALASLVGSLPAPGTVDAQVAGAAGEAPAERTTPYTPDDQLDLNKASLEQLLSLPLEAEDARAIYEWRRRHGPFQSVYGLRRIEQIDGAEFERIKPLLFVAPPELAQEVTQRIEEIQRRLAREETPAAAAIDEWEDLVVDPLDINRATVDDLVMLDDVSLVDAVAVVKHRMTRGRIDDLRALRRNVRGLTYYGYTRMRDFVRFDPRPEGLDFHGLYRVIIDHRSEVDVGEDDENLDLLTSRLEASVAGLAPGSGEEEPGANLEGLQQAGWTDQEIDRLRGELEQDLVSIRGIPAEPRILQKVRARWGRRIKLGFVAERDPGERTDDLVKGYLGLYDMGPIDRLILGTYRLTLGQSLVIDNDEPGGYESPFRRTDRIAGLFGDATASEEFIFRGAAMQASLGRIRPLVFYSRDRKDAILNRDGTANSLITSWPRPESTRDRLLERTFGGSLRFDLGGLGPLPIGTYVAANGYEADYDPGVRIDPTTLDIPGDGDTLRDPNYLQAFSGDRRRVYGTDFRTLLGNVSVEGEYGRLDGGGDALVLKARAQYEYLYLLGLYRRYDADFDNPYARPFMEQRKYDDTLFEREYRLLNPLHSYLQDYPAPKAEEGLYFETRYQITRKIIITRAYLDTWRNVAWGLPNLRIQGEIEYRPVFPLRFRLKQKWQRKSNPGDVVATTSRTSETTLRAFALLSQRDFFGLELRYGRVRLTPTLRWGGDMMMDGGFLSGNWEHHFSPALSVQSGIVIWETNGMSQWTFEDRGIDFLNGRGMRYYITVLDQLSPGLSLRFKFRKKNTELPHSGIYGPESEYRYGGGSAVPVKDFVDYQDEYSASIQLDFRW